MNPPPEASEAFLAGWHDGAKDKPLTQTERRLVAQLLFGEKPKARKAA